MRGGTGLSATRTFSEYFAGIGLVRLGLESQGWRAVFANDIDPKKHKLYSDNFRGADRLYVVDDIHQLGPATVPPSLMATASFPCIDLSIAGNRSGLNGRHSSAFWGFIEILQRQGQRRPPLVLLENVTGWLTSGQGRDFPAAIKALNSLGYVCDVLVLNALHFTPQSRPRLFVIGARHRSPHPDAAHRLRGRSPHLWTKRLLQSVSAHPDCQWMTLELPSPPHPKSNLAELLDDLRHDDERWWPPDEVDHLLSQMSPKHLAVVQHLASGPAVSCATVYKRVRQGGTRAEVRADGVAGCLRTPVGGSSKQIVITASRRTLRVRWMTAREYARLQGVPESYIITVPYLQALWGFGDAVCVPAVAWLAEHALNPLANEL